jgi:serine protease AprX
MPRKVVALPCALIAAALLSLGRPSGAGAQILPPPPVAPVTADADKLDNVLRSRLLQFGDSRIVARARDAESLPAIVLLIQQLGGTLGHELPILNAVAATLPNSALLTLAASTQVERIVLDRLILGSLERTSEVVGVSGVRQEFGYDGRGIGVAVIDSGVTSWHDDLADAAPATQRVREFVDFVARSQTPYDDNGHGTHVAGIIAGNGVDSGGARSGIAPAAHLVVLKVLDQQGRGRISDVIAALDYVFAHRRRLEIKVVNLSVGAQVNESYDVDFLTLAAKRLVELGIVVVAAAGNAGTTTDGKNVYGAITAPGNAPWVLTVGASSHGGTIDRSDDTIAAFSSRGPAPIDQIAKPDLVAPGVSIVSLSNPDSWLYTNRAQSLVSGTVASPQLPYLSLSGTSQSAPVVSGTVALMLQANPNLSPNAIKAILQYTSQMYSGYDSLTQGAGFLNAQGAIDLARFFADPSIGIRGAPEWSSQIIWGNHRARGGVLLPASNAWSSDLVWGSDATSDGQPITWGIICAEGADCTGGSPSWSDWRTQCSDTSCTTAVWRAEDFDNVVWGSACGGADCADTTWSTAYDDDTVVWGNTYDDDTVVWGNGYDDDTVVWGNNCTDAGCEAASWEE